MENNKSNDRSVQQKNLYKALVDAYEADKGILDTYGDTVTLKRRRDDEDEDKEPSAGSNRGSKRRRAGKEPESTSAPKEKTSKSTGKSKEGSKSHQSEDPTHTIDDLEDSTHQEFDTGFTKDQLVDDTTQLSDSTLARNEDPRESFDELMDTPLDFSAFVLNQLKLTNLNVEERLALGVSLRMFTRSIVIRRRVEDLQLGFESYQKKLNLTRPDTYRSDLKRMSTNTAYSNPRGFIYQNKDKKNRLMRIDELHKFSNGTLKDVRSALDDILKRIRMQYLPQTIWRNVDK
ncbi:hypothetical protein Tco_1544534 [Tanacetum coccineum]